MTKEFKYIIDEVNKIIYLSPPTGSPRFLMAQARDYIFSQHFGDEYKRTILNEESWLEKIKLNKVQTIPATAVKKMEDK